MGLLRRGRAAAGSALAHRVPHRGGRTDPAAPRLRRRAVHLAALPPQAGHGAVAERVGRGVRGSNAGLRPHRHVLSGGRGGVVRPDGDRRRRGRLQMPCAGGGLRRPRPASRRRVGRDPGRRRPGGDPLRVRARAGSLHRSRPRRGPDASLPSPAVGHRAHGDAGVRAVPGPRRPVRERASGHHHGLHRVQRAARALPGGSAPAAARPAEAHPVRQRLPQHPVPLRRRPPSRHGTRAW
ncbi:hypothetical protein RhoFasK5_01461|nr:hypothetical protein [Rhodococcus kroppenstedtii]